MRMGAKQIVQATGGQFLVEPIDAAEVLTGITLDSRTVAPGDVYVAIQGEHADGHAFVEAALMQGARGALVSEPVDERCMLLAREMGAAIILVPNAEHAVADMARAWRAHLSAKVVAITGSVGKTTTKNLTRDVLASIFKTCATKGNQNNELGGPLTLLAAEPTDEAVVMEMGMDGAGQIRFLCRMARPDWGVVTNVGTSHMEMLGSQENIARAKAELLEELPDGTGQAFLNGACAYAPFLAEVARLDARNVSLCLYGTPPRANGAAQEPAETGAGDALPSAHRRVWAEDVTLDEDGSPHFQICFAGFRASGDASPTLFDMDPDTERAPVALALRGEHNVANALAAAAVGRAMGIAPHVIAQALARSVAEAGRQEMLRGRDGYTIINDAYNASPDSMRASLAMLAAMEVAGKRYAVLGDMGELGDTSDACHVGVGHVVVEQGADELVCIGQKSRLIAEGAREAGMDAAHIVCVDTIGEALEHLEGTLCAEDVVLVKASNFMGLTRLAEGLAS